jgi:hypothetical protein
MDGRPRGSRVAAHLAVRERPGEVVVVAGLLGCCTLPVALIGAVVVALVLSEKLPPTTLHIPAQAVFLGFCLAALWRGARWGWLLAMVVLGGFTGASLVGAVRAGVEADLARLIVLGAFAGIGGATLFLLGKARRRYQTWAARGGVEDVRAE